MTQQNHYNANPGSTTPHDDRLMTADLDDYRWLVSDRAAPYLDVASSRCTSLVRLATSLRRDLSTSRVHLVLEQTDLRHHARRKFVDAGRMFFTRLGYEQATDQWIAEYKSRRFIECGTIADLCCGIGGDLRAMADTAASTIVGVDRSAVMQVISTANCRVKSERRVAVRREDVRRFSLPDIDAWHLDPDRRPSGSRTTRPELHDPPLETIDRMLGRNTNASIKLAPATKVTDSWAAEAELEWIGHGRQCQQLVAWFGDLANRAGKKRATVVASDGTTGSVPDDGGGRAEHSRSIGRYVYDPHSAVLAARLVGPLAREHNLTTFSDDRAYLTNDSLRCSMCFTAFEVTDVLSFDEKRIRHLLGEMRIGTVEIKKRGLDLEPETLRKTLQLKGDNSAALLIARTDLGVRAVIARRIGETSKGSCDQSYS